MRTRSAGFTLLEVVVSLALLSIAVGAILQIFSGGFKNIHRIEMAHRAMAHGENVMSELLADGELTEATSLAEDLDEDFRYVATLQDWEPPVDKLMVDVTEDQIRLLEIQVRIYFKNDRFGKYYELASLKAISNIEDGIGTGDAIRQLFDRENQ